jgi:C1A family cysteine protease
MKIAILLLASLALASAAVPLLRDEEYEFLFTAWAKEHGKEYEVDEAIHRFNIWKTNLETIRNHNADASKGFKLSMNKFGDLTNEEFRGKYNGFKNRENSFLRSRNVANLSLVGLPSSVDWNQAGKLTPVKDQGQCGSCWSFSTTGALECAYAIKSGSVISLSEQELVDCSGPQGDHGCDGGLMDDAFQFVISNGGVCSESSYPYTASQGSCDSSCTSQVTISGFQDVTANDENALQAAVATTAVSVAVDAGGDAWQFYSNGVMQGDCGTDLDHGVLAAGYGTENGVDYWYVKNSWGPGWGENGYVKLQRGQGGAGMCGITLSASYPTGASHA